MKDSPVVFITGATSGIGAACAKYLANAGLTIYGGGRRIKKETTTGEKVTLLPLDVNEDESVQSAVNTVIEREDRLDVVINNAGFGLSGPLESTTVEEAKSQFETNFFGVHRVNRAVLPQFHKQGSGRIIIVSSIGGRIGLPYQGMYSAAKFALEGYAEALSMELKADKVPILLIEPGDFATGFTDVREFTSKSKEGDSAFEKARDTFQKDERGGKDPELIAKTLLKYIRKKRWPRRRMVGAWDQKLAVHMRPLMPDSWFEMIIRSHYFG